ncbi:helix-turn-helix domain-containing protein [Streptosporangium sp. NPDC048047]|uniref:helix-turn-helix domain-containing protein n=1 Tax=Streptosporangium sp. NPDC048047 TaxID=3155748 RepID=UPI003429AE41
MTLGDESVAVRHTRWVRPQPRTDDPERVLIREALAFGRAVYDRRNALGLTVAELAGRASMTEDEIERIEEGGTAPTAALLRHLAGALPARSHHPGVCSAQQSLSGTEPPGLGTDRGTADRGQPEVGVTSGARSRSPVSPARRARRPK